MSDPVDWDLLIPELPKWNGGKGISPSDWAACSGNLELAVGYTTIFCPDFVEFEGYVLRDGFSLESLRGFEEQTGNDRKSVEWVMNHWHISSLHAFSKDDAQVPDEVFEARLRFLGRKLTEIHQAKLAWQFPEKKFRVEFNDEPGLDFIDYQMSFWQID